MVINKEIPIPSEKLTTEEKLIKVLNIYVKLQFENTDQLKCP